MAFKGFSATYTSVDKLEDEEVESENSDMVTPFPGYMKSMYVDNDSSDKDEYVDDN